MKIFVGNLPFSAGADDVKNLFAGFGNVLAVDIVEDSDGQSRGFGFVDMEAEAQAYDAIKALDGKEFMGRVINLSPAKVKPVITGSKHGEGRRSRSFQKRASQEGPRNALQERPAKPWRKETGEGTAKPWQKRPAYGKPKPWESRPIGEHRPWERDRGERPAKPWRRETGEGTAKPWQKRPAYGKPKPWESRPSGEYRPWERDRGERPAKPWRKETGVGGAKPWQKRPAYGKPKPWESRPSGEHRPGERDRGERPARHWRKDTGESSGKPWQKRQEKSAGPWERWKKPRPQAKENQEFYSGRKPRAGKTGSRRHSK